MPCLRARFVEFAVGHALTAHDVLESATFVHDDEGLAFEDGPGSLEAEDEVGLGEDQQGDRADREDGGGDRRVVLSDALLNEVSDDEEQDELEGSHFAELAFAERAEYEPNEQIHESSADNDVHVFLSGCEVGREGGPGDVSSFAAQHDIARGTPMAAALYLHVDRDGERGAVRRLRSAR